VTQSIKLISVSPGRKIKAEIKPFCTRPKRLAITSTSTPTLSRYPRTLQFTLPSLFLTLTCLSLRPVRSDLISNPLSPRQHSPFLKTRFLPRNPSPPLLFALPPISNPSPNLAPSPPPHDHPYQSLTQAWTRRNT